MMLMANDKNAMDNVRIASTACQMQDSASIVISSIQVNAMLDESIVLLVLPGACGANSGRPQVHLW